MDREAPSNGVAGTGAVTRIGAWAVVIALIVFVWRALLPTLGAVNYQPDSDDGYYLRYMQEVGTKGLGAFPDLFRFYLGDERHWIFPPPSRVGFIAVSALWSRLFGASFTSLSYLSLAAHLALIALTYVFAKRWFESWKALLCAALVAFSPLQLGLARLALTDSFISLSQALCVWLFIEYVRAPERRRRGFAFAIAFSAAIATKEIAVLLALPFAVYAAVERFHRKRDVPIAATAALLIVPIVVSGVLWIFAAGDVDTLWRTLRIVLLSPASNEYAIAFGSGGWYRYPIDELLMSPWPTLLGLAAIGVVLVRWRSGAYGTLGVAMSLVYAFQVGVLGLFTKNLRYVAVLETPLRVLAVVLVWELFDSKRRLVGRVLCTALVAGLCCLDFADFKLFWLHWQTNDPVTHVLGAVRGLFTINGAPPP